MENKWTLRVVIVLIVCLTRNLTSGHGDRTSLDSNKTTPHSHDSSKVKLAESLAFAQKMGSRTESFKAGSDMVTLICTNTNIAWSEMIYVIWRISVKEKTCYIGMAVNDTDVNTCQDGKIINRTGDYSLIIPHFSIKDEGNYICDVFYRAGGYVETIHVSARGESLMYGWLEVEDGHTYAVCEVQSFPAASIRWETLWNVSLPETHSSRDATGVFIVKSRLQLPQNAFHKQLTCVATARNFEWPEERLRTFMFKDSVKRSSVLLGVYAIWPSIKLLISLYIIQRKLRQFRICCTSKTSTPAEESNPEPHLYEEVELYVNSISNSSAARAHSPADGLQEKPVNNASQSHTHYYTNTARSSKYKIQGFEESGSM